MVNGSSPIKPYQDIDKAQQIGATSGTCAQVALYLMAQKTGVDYAKTNIVNLQAPLLRNAFKNASIDAGIAWAPYSMALDAEGLRIVGWDPEYTPGGVCPRMTGVRPAFIKSHPEIGVKLLQVDAMASEAVAKNPQLAIDRLGSGSPIGCKLKACAYLAEARSQGATNVPAVSSSRTNIFATFATPSPLCSLNQTIEMLK